LLTLRAQGILETLRLFHFSFFRQVVGILLRVISLSQGRYLHTQNNRRQAPMGIKSTIPVFERGHFMPYYLWSAVTDDKETKLTAVSTDNIESA
jgi:hypothetical protein